MGVAGVLAGASAIMQTRSQNAQIKEQEKAKAQTVSNYVQAMNYSFQNLEAQRQSAFASTVEDLANTRLQALRQEASVNAAVNEESLAGGRTADLLKRSVGNDAARTIDSIKSNYTNKANEIDLNKEAELLNTKQALKGLPTIQRPSMLSQAIGIASSVYNIKNMTNATNALKITRGQ